jgi:putative transposase
MNHLTYNVELEVNQVEKDKLFSILEEQREIVNEISAIIHKNKPEKLNLKLVHDKCYQQIKGKFPTAFSQVLIKSEQEIIANLKSAKSNRHINHQQIVKHNLSLRLDKRIYTELDKSSIKLSMFKGKKNKVNFKLYDKVNELFDKYATCDPLLFIRNNKVYLSIPFKLPEVKLVNKETLGIDLGMRRLYTTSDGDCLKGTEYNKHKRRIRYNKRMCQRANTKSSKKKLKTYKRKEANFSKNYINHVANKMLKTDKSIIVMEDLTKIKQKKYKRQNLNAKSQVPFYILREILTYKAQLLGKQVVTVNPAYTSQDDCRGNSRGLRKGCRYVGIDGVIMDADWNASHNIISRYNPKHPISFIPLDGGLNLVGRLLSTNQ